MNIKKNDVLKLKHKQTGEVHICVVRRLKKDRILLYVSEVNLEVWYSREWLLQCRMKKLSFESFNDKTIIPSCIMYYLLFDCIDVEELRLIKNAIKSKKTIVLERIIKSAFNGLDEYSKFLYVNDTVKLYIATKEDIRHMQSIKDGKGIFIAWVVDESKHDSFLSWEKLASFYMQVFK